MPEWYATRSPSGIRLLYLPRTGGSSGADDFRPTAGD